jgi:hypothetical protein
VAARVFSCVLHYVLTHRITPRSYQGGYQQGGGYQTGGGGGYGGGGGGGGGGY